MERLIDGTTLEEHLNFRLNALRADYGEYDQYTDGFDECVGIVEDFQPTDPVHAAGACYCRECCWYNRPEGCVMRRDLTNDDGEALPRPNDFCRYGEKAGELDD